MTYDGYIFDLDGVLIETRDSFSRAVCDAVTCKTRSEKFTVREWSLLKTLPGFNNDWSVAIAGAAWIQFRDHWPFQTYLNSLDGHGSGLSAVRRTVPEVTAAFESRLTRLTQEAYGGTTACYRLYGFEPEFICKPGRWEAETSLVIRERILRIKESMGIVTGRNKAETELAFEILGWDLAGDYVATGDDPNLDKPNPSQLHRIIRRLKCQNPLYIGDNQDDRDLVNNYRKDTGLPLGFCMVTLNVGSSGADMSVMSVNELFNRLGLNHD